METLNTQSVIPNTIPSTLVPIIVSTAGENGIDKSVFSPRQSTAGYGQDGKDGQNAATPACGGSGRDVNVRLKFDPERPGSIEVTIKDHGQFKISSNERLLLDTHGGNGGNGGFGQDGQHGGAGYDGSNATSIAEAGNGGPGGRGGNGGSGTSGADGGKGGNFLATVPEEKLDLLLAVECKTEGGIGGAAGRHGMPGHGGRGGRGGKGWSSSLINRLLTDPIPEPITRKKGSRGSDGPAGLPPLDLLHPGQRGNDGRICLNVMRQDGTIKSYPRRYHIVVESFDIVDENNDGINEPGEFLIVKNIVIRNDGPMPSPSGQLIKIVIRSSTCLEPETSGPLNLPDSIVPGGRVVVPGQLRALIRPEKNHRADGEELLLEDNVSLLAYSERLVRSIPEFSGGVPIIVQYPLQVPRPVYMNCLQKGDEMAIKWMVNNISRKIYGNPNGRKVWMKLVDGERNFLLQSANQSLNYIQDDVDSIEPKAGSAFGETILVADETRTFTTGCLSLELHLSDLHTGKMRRIMRHQISIQVSEGYQFNSDAQFLLVVNAATNNNAITQIQQFIRTRLYLDVDTINVSLTGTLEDPKSGKTTLLKYKGKSIIIAGNPFTYFGKSKRYNWDFIPPREAQILSTSGTSFLFCYVRSDSAQKSLLGWISVTKYPLNLESNRNSIVVHKDWKALLKAIPTQTFPDDLHLRLKNQSQEVGEMLSRKLAKQFPMRRFVVALEDPARGMISVVEGQPRTANCIMSSLPIINGDGFITDHQMVMIIASIPFHRLTIIFWNIVRSLDSTGITADVMYRNLPGFYNHRELVLNHGYGDGRGEDSSRSLIKEKIWECFGWAVEYAINSDIQQLCHDDTIKSNIGTSKTALVHTPRLQSFLSGVPEDSITAPKKGTELAVQVLGSLNAALEGSDKITGLLSSIPGLDTWRANLRRDVSKYMKNALEFMAHDSKRSDIKKNITKEAKGLTKGLVKDMKSPKNSEEMIRQKLARLTGDQHSVTGFVDIAAAEGDYIHLSPLELYDKQSQYKELLNRQMDDFRYAKAVMEETITPVFETLDFLPVTSFL